MRDKIFSKGFAYHISGNTSIKLTEICKIAAEFANEIGVPVDSVLYDGVIEHSNWCKNFQLYFAPVANCPEGYTEVEDYFNYIKEN